MSLYRSSKIFMHARVVNALKLDLVSQNLRNYGTVYFF